MNNVKVIFTELIIVMIFSSPVYGNEWQQCQPLPEAMCPHVVTLDGKIYATNSGIMYIYDPATDNWTTKGNINSINIGSLVELNGRIFEIGGNTIEEFNTANGTWINKKNLPVGCDDIGVAIYQGKIYIIGGTANNSALDNVQVYDPQNDSWEIKAKMKRQRIGPAVVCLNNKIYAICGWTQAYTAVGGIEEYDISTDTWTEKAPYAVSSQSPCQAVTINGKIYSIADSYINEYDPDLDKWTKKINTSPVGFFTKLVVNNKLYMFGGLWLSGSGMSNKAIRYDPVANTETFLPNLSEAKSDCGAAEINGKIFIMGGTLDWTGTYFSTVEAYDTNKDAGILYKNELKNFSLLQNYPNPFNPDTIIRYQLPNSTHVELIIFDSLGREIATLIDKEQTAGDHEVKFDGKHLDSGIYFARLTTKDFTETKKMVIQK